MPDSDMLLYAQLARECADSQPPTTPGDEAIQRRQEEFSLMKEDRAVFIKRLPQFPQHLLLLVYKKLSDLSPLSTFNRPVKNPFSPAQLLSTCLRQAVTIMNDPLRVEAEIAKAEEASLNVLKLLNAQSASVLHNKSKKPDKTAFDLKHIQVTLGVCGTAYHAVSLLSSPRDDVMREAWKLLGCMCEYGTRTVQSKVLKALNSTEGITGLLRVRDELQRLSKAIKQEWRPKSKKVRRPVKPAAGSAKGQHLLLSSADSDGFAPADVTMLASVMELKIRPAQSSVESSFSELQATDVDSEEAEFGFGYGFDSAVVSHQANPAYAPNSPLTDTWMGGDEAEDQSEERVAGTQSEDEEPMQTDDVKLLRELCTSLRQLGEGGYVDMQNFLREQKRSDMANVNFIQAVANGLHELKQEAFGSTQCRTRLPLLTEMLETLVELCQGNQDNQEAAIDHQAVRTVSYCISQDCSHQSYLQEYATVKNASLELLEAMLEQVTSELQEKGGKSVGHRRTSEEFRSDTVSAMLILLLVFLFSFLSLLRTTRAVWR